MTFKSGVGGQWGIVTETTLGTAQAVTTFTEIVSEGLVDNITKVRSQGLHAGGLASRASRYTLISADASGPVSMELPTKGFGKYLQHMMGSFAATATQIGATPAYYQVHTLASTDGKAFTGQVGIPDTTGTVNPKTVSGAKIADWEVAVTAQNLAMVNLNIDALRLDQTGAGALGLQSASFTANTGLFSALDATFAFGSSLTVDGTTGAWTVATPTTVGAVKSFSLKGGQPKNTNRFVIGSQTKLEQVINDFQTLTWTATVEYSTQTFWTALKANTSYCASLTFQNALDIGSGNHPTVRFVMPALFVDKGTPALTGPDVITVQYEGACLDDGTNGILQGYIVSTDTTV